MSGECGSGWETEAIQYTFKNMQLLGYEVKLYRYASSKKRKEGEPRPTVEVDLSKVYVKPCKDVKKEMKAVRKRNSSKNENGNDEDLSDEDEEAKYD